MLDSTRDLFDTLSKVLLRCWLFGFVLLFVWFGALMSGIVYKLHGPMMELTTHELQVSHYCGIALLKLFILACFFIPWLSIKLVLRKQ